MSSRLKLLVIGAHPDDEILGCGGTIAKYIEQGHEVYILICTQAYIDHDHGWDKAYCEAQPVWQAKVDECLHIKQRFNFPFPAIQLNNIPHGELSAKIAEIIEKVKPDIVFTHFRGDLNLDHVLVSFATQVACRPPKRIRLYAYEVLSNTELGEPFKPTYYETLSKNHFLKKIEAYKCYEIESKVCSRSIVKLERLAKKRADEIRANYAEAFQIIREVNS